MPVVRTAVLLFAYPAGQNLNLHGDVLWYRNYFFGPVYGLAGYWIEQTDSQLVLDGELFDWAVVSDPNPNLMNRTAVINRAIKAMENDRGANFNPFDIVILVLGVPPSVQTDGGSTTAESEDRNHAGIVILVGGPFDFVAHELGHALGLNHSYGKPSYQDAPWSQPGEYGRPYCVMSASGYGGIGGPFFPAAPRDGRTEYSGLGPSLNAGTALSSGWLDAHVHNLPGGQVVLDLRSRHWLGKVAGLTSQALEIRAPDGKTYVLEYRENAGWDEGQGSPVPIANPKLVDQQGIRWVTLRYEIEPVPNGSRLRLFNQPDDETYELRVSATLTTAVGTGGEEDWVEFAGIEYRYPQRFYDEWDACLDRFVEIGQRYVRYSVLLEPDLWKRVPDRLVPRVERSLKLLGQLNEQEEELAFHQVASDLAALIGTASVTPLVLSQEESVELVHQVVEQEPHFSEREAHLAERELHLAERQPGERVDATWEPGGFLAFLRRVLGRNLGR